MRTRQEQISIGTEDGTPALPISELRWLVQASDNAGGDDDTLVHFSGKGNAFKLTVEHDLSQKPD